MNQLNPIYLVKLETSLTAILPPTPVSVLSRKEKDITWSEFEAYDDISFIAIYFFNFLFSTQFMKD